MITLSTLIGACARDTLWATHLVLHRFESGFSHMKALRRAIEATQSSSSQLSSARLRTEVVIGCDELDAADE